MHHVRFLWNISELLRGPFPPAEHGAVLLPFTVLRRLDAVLAETKQAVLAVAADPEMAHHPLRERRLTEAAGHSFYNTSPLDLTQLLTEPQGLRQKITAYIAGFSPNIHDIFERFAFDKTLAKLEEKHRLPAVAERFAQVDVHPKTVSNFQMGLIFEELIRRAHERSSDMAGDYYTPCEVIRLMAKLVFANDDAALAHTGAVRSIYDPTAGTGGMLSVADEFLRSTSPGMQLKLYGQECNDFSYAICKADMVIKGQDEDNIRLGDTLTADQFPDQRFDYGLANPPFGVDWKKQRAKIEEERARDGSRGRFAPGVPAVRDGAMLFLLHLISKMRAPDQGGSRIAIVLNGSPLFAGAAGSGESNIRTWLLQHDLLEAIVGLPKDMFYNTGIPSYIWLLTNRKEKRRRGKVQLIDGREFFTKLRKSLGSKRNELSPEDIDRIMQLYADFEECEHSKILPNDSFRYRTITVEQPLRLSWQATPERIDAALNTRATRQLNTKAAQSVRAALTSLDPAQRWRNQDEFQRAITHAARNAGLTLTTPLLSAITRALGDTDQTADIFRTPQGTPEPDTSLRDTENVPWHEDIHTYLDREVRPYAPDAWINESKTKEGAEIPFARHFYTYVPPRPLAVIDQELTCAIENLRLMFEEYTKHHYPHP